MFAGKQNLYEASSSPPLAHSGHVYSRISTHDRTIASCYPISIKRSIIQGQGIRNDVSLPRHMCYFGTLSLPTARTVSKTPIVCFQIRSDHGPSLYRPSTPGAETGSHEELMRQAPGPYLSVHKTKACLSPQSSTFWPKQNISTATNPRSDANATLHTIPDDSGGLSRTKMSVLTSPG